jgi:hypothetical protein
MKLLRNITAIVLLGAVLLPLLTASFLQVKQLVVQWHMRESLEHEQLTTISVKTNAIHWIKKNKECLIDGELFDVKRIQVNGDKTLLTGLYDAEEKAIKQLMKETGEKQSSSQQQNLLKLFSFTACINAGIQAEPPSYTFIYRNTLPIYSNHYCNPVLSIVAPPPRC